MTIKSRNRHAVQGFKRINCVLVDFEGTLSDNSWRIKHLPTAALANDPMQQAAAWDDYYRKLVDDPPNLKIVALINGAVKQHGMRIVVATGVSEKHRELVNDWLQNQPVAFDRLMLRDDGDTRSNPEIKHFMVRSLRGIGWEPIIAVDDLPEVLDLYRGIGIASTMIVKNGRAYRYPLSGITPGIW